MKMFASSKARGRGILLFTLFFLSLAAPVAQAAENDHGNPGQFIENIRKGLSGLGKYFWSPFGETEKKTTTAPQAVPHPEGKKAARETKDGSASHEKQVKAAPVAPVVTKPGSDARASQAAKKMPAVKGVKPATKVVTSTPAPVKSKNHRAEGMAKSEKSADEAAQGKRIVTAPAARQPDSPVAVGRINAAQEKERLRLPKKDGNEKHSKNRVAAGHVRSGATGLKPGKSAESKKTVEQKPSIRSKSLPLHKPVAKQPVMKKQAVVSGKPALSGKQHVDRTGAIAVKKARRETVKKKTVSGRVAAAVGTERVKKNRKQTASDHKGTYFWVPDRDSPLARAFGQTGLTAAQMTARGETGRTDGRWVYAPYRRGVAPGIYGLGDMIRNSENADGWVGRGRNWVYVFDKSRTYSSTLKGMTDRKVQKKKTASGEIKKKKAAAAKSTTETDGEKQSVVREQGQGTNAKVTAKAGAKTGKTTPDARVRKVMKPVGKTPDRKKAAARAAKGSVQRPAGNTVHPKSRAVGKVKTVKNGAWSKINGRWVYVPRAAAKDRAGTSGAGTRVRQAGKAPATGGWVQCNGRWVYVTPKKSPARKTRQMAKATDTGTKAVKAAKTTKRTDRQPAGDAATSGVSATAGVTVARKKTAATSVAGKSGAGKKQDRQKSGPGAGPTVREKSGLAEGPAPARSAIGSHAESKGRGRRQMVWVREQNRWVYTTVRPGGEKLKAAPNTGTNRSVGRNRGVTASVGRTAGLQTRRKEAGGSRTGASGRQFYFFVPGRIPGSGDWYVAPVELLKKATKLRNPASNGR